MTAVLVFMVALKVRRLVHSFSKATSLGVGVGITENLTNKIP
jgi:hypothetical protein